MKACGEPGVPSSDPDSHAARIAVRLKGDHPIKWVFAGDSITHGCLHTLGHRSYVEHFAERVRGEMRRLRDCVINSGTDGWTISCLADDLHWNVHQHMPDLVSLGFGMNDCRRSPGKATVFARDYREVLRRLINEFDSQLILHTPNGVDQRDPHYRPHLPPYVEAIRELAGEFHAVLVDHSAAWQEAERSGNAVYWVSDSTHPNEYGHRANANSQR